MKKIPTIFVRGDKGKITTEWHPDCTWVRDGEGQATRKFDGQACMLRHGHFFKRLEVKKGKVPPSNFIKEQETPDGTFGWVPVTDGPEDKWFREALKSMGSAILEGTYEMLSPRFQGRDSDHINPEKVTIPTLVRHGDVKLEGVPRDFEGLKTYFAGPAGNHIEGVVWHHEDGRMAKIKRRDFR